jgi:hypothetical protein
MPEHSNTGLSSFGGTGLGSDNENYFTELIERRTVKRSNIKRLGERKKERKMV